MCCLLQTYKWGSVRPAEGEILSPPPLAKPSTSPTLSDSRCQLQCGVLGCSAATTPGATLRVFLSYVITRPSMETRAVGLLLLGPVWLVDSPAAAATSGTLWPVLPLLCPVWLQGCTDGSMPSTASMLWQHDSCSFQTMPAVACPAWLLSCAAATRPITEPWVLQLLEPVWLPGTTAVDCWR